MSDTTPSIPLGWSVWPDVSRWHAIKYGPTGPTVRLSATTQEELAREIERVDQEFSEAPRLERIAAMRSVTERGHAG